jgi:kynurenine formamidase
MDAKKIKLIDLTTPFDRDYSVPNPPFPHVTMEHKFIRTVPRDGRYTTQITITTHAGTHMDAPMHVFSREEKQGKYYLGDIPLQQLFGETVVLDIPKEPKEPHGEPITAEDLELASKAKPELEIREGDIVLVHTGWGRYFVDDPKTAEWIFYRGPGLDSDGAQWLVQKKIKGYGQDTIGTQYKAKVFYKTEEELERGERPSGEPVHKILLGADIVLFEHLYNLNQIVGQRVVCGFFPLNFLHIEACPIRAIAFVEK